MSDIVDFGIPVRIETWRTVKFLSYIISPSKIFITSFYIIIINFESGKYWKQNYRNQKSDTETDNRIQITVTDTETEYRNSVSVSEATIPYTRGNYGVYKGYIFKNFQSHGIKSSKFAI